MAMAKRPVPMQELVVGAGKWARTEEEAGGPDGESVVPNSVFVAMSTPQLPMQFIHAFHEADQFRRFAQMALDCARLLWPDQSWQMIASAQPDPVELKKDAADVKRVMQREKPEPCQCVTCKKKRELEANDPVGWEAAEKLLNKAPGEHSHTGAFHDVGLVVADAAEHGGFSRGVVVVAPPVQGDPVPAGRMFRDPAHLRRFIRAVSQTANRIWPAENWREVDVEEEVPTDPDAGPLGDAVHDGSRPGPDADGGPQPDF